MSKLIQLTSLIFVSVTGPLLLAQIPNSIPAASKHDLMESAKRGDLVAIYQASKVESVDATKREWLQKAASMGYGPAILDLADLTWLQVQRSKPTMPEKTQKYIEYQQAISESYKALMIWANNGDLESMYLIGARSKLFLKEGLTSNENCLMWLRKAAELGHDEAPFALALTLLEKHQTSEKRQGFEWLKISTNKGNRRTQAIVSLVRYYSYGFSAIELKQNKEEAWKWARKGAEIEGTSVGMFLIENGLQNPDKILPEEVQ